MQETTLILIKPDAVERGLVGEVLLRFERRGLRIEKIVSMVASKERIDQHYAHLIGREYYPRVLAWVTRGPLVAALVSGEGAITACRQTVGTTNPLEAAPGTIRADLATWTGSNLVHASASAEEAAVEIGIWFADYIREITDAENPPTPEVEADI